MVKHIFIAPIKEGANDEKIEEIFVNVIRLSNL